MHKKQYMSIPERVEKFKQFYRMENKEPLIGFFAGSEYPLHRYHASASLPEGRELIPGDFNVASYVADCDRLFQEHEACGGDFIWSASAFWGIPWLEAALGCPVYASQSTGSIHSEPPPYFKGADSIPQFDAYNPWIQKTGEFLAGLAEGSGGRWPVGTTRMRGISDLLSALYGGENFLYAMLEEPQEVSEICRKLTDFYIAYAQYQLNRIPLFYGGIGSFYYNMWAPAGTVWHQEDAAALLSPVLYDQFIRPCNERIVRAFPNNIMHQHPTGYVPTDAYLEMGMTALELHVDEGGPSAEELYPWHKKILDKTPLLIWGRIPEKDLCLLFSKLPPQGLAVLIAVDGPEQAHAIWEKHINSGGKCNE